MEYNLLVDLSGSYNAVLMRDPSRIQPPNLPRVFGLRWRGRSTLGRHSCLDNPAEEAREDLLRCAPVLPSQSFLQGMWEAEVAFLLCSKAGMSSSGMWGWGWAGTRALLVLILHPPCRAHHITQVCCCRTCGGFVFKYRTRAPSHLFPSYLQLSELENNLVCRYF